MLTDAHISSLGYLWFNISLLHSSRAFKKQLHVTFDFSFILQASIQSNIETALIK